MIQNKKWWDWEVYCSNQWYYAKDYEIQEKWLQKKKDKNIEIISQWSV